METTLRVLISLTHDDHEWCKSISSNESLLPTVIRIIAISHSERASILKTSDLTVDNEDGVESQAASLLDRLCLALGLFTNLVQTVEEAQDAVSHIGALSCQPSRIDMNIYNRDRPSMPR